MPVGAHFPHPSRPTWFIHLGADGLAARNRAPARAASAARCARSSCPTIVGQSSDAYLMMRGNGITRWPRGGHLHPSAPGRFIITFGVGFDIVYGFKPVVWAEVFARADILVATYPMSFVGVGTIGGGLHIGPFSITVSATVHVEVIEGRGPPRGGGDRLGRPALEDPHEDARGGVRPPRVGDPAPPATHPLDGAGGHALCDARYHRVGLLSTSREDAQRADPVWPDSVPMLTFTTAPTLPTTSTQFPDLVRYPEGMRALPLGSEMATYTFELPVGVTLVDEANPLGRWRERSAAPGRWASSAVPLRRRSPPRWPCSPPRGTCGSTPRPMSRTGPPAGALHALTTVCGPPPLARAGWAIGWGARRSADAYRLPPDPIDVDPLQSQVTVSSQLFVDRGPGRAPAVLDYDHLDALAPGWSYTGPRTRSLSVALSAGAPSPGGSTPVLPSCRPAPPASVRSLATPAARAAHPAASR